MLHMTATPIPRTLALARYGDLDTSALRELPARAPADRDADRRRRARSAHGPTSELREQLDAGRQAFVVCPLIERGRRRASAPARERRPRRRARIGELRAATAELERLRKGELAGYGSCCCTAACARARSRRRWRAFASGEADVLVATTVIEVGIDVPNATVMLVENAERFGISQLHQLRGRVGRGEHRVDLPA